MGKTKGSVGYWRNHQYKRRKRTDVTHYCGRKILETLSQKASHHKKHAVVKQGSIATAFATGGRSMEFLMSLRADQIIERGDDILISGMKVLKQYNKVRVSTSLEEEYYGYSANVYNPTVHYREVTINKSEPLVDIFIDFAEKVYEEDKSLPTRYRRTEYKGMLFPYSYGWFYKWVRETDPEWWPHRFRAERASHLASRYGFSVKELMEWFGWTSMEVALEYIRLDIDDLRRKMARGEL